MMKNIRAAWKEYITIDDVTPGDMLHLCLLKAMKARSDEKYLIFLGLAHKAFTPISNRKKIANGQNRWDGLATAAREIYVRGPRGDLFKLLETDEERALWYALVHRVQEDESLYATETAH